MPIHIRAQPRDIAPIVLLVGDPARATAVAARLDEARLYNDHRGLLGYTGESHGVLLSVQTTGMGAPSAAIVVEELAQLGARTLIRLGTCGGIAENVRVLDLAVATAATADEGTTRQYTAGSSYAPAPTHRVTSALAAACEALSASAHVGPFLTQDAFYCQPDDWERWRRLGIVAVEMEASAIFTVAAIRGLEAGAVCLVVDQVGDRTTWAGDDDIARGTGQLIDVGLRAARSL